VQFQAAEAIVPFETATFTDLTSHWVISFAQQEAVPSEFNTLSTFVKSQQVGALQSSFTDFSHFMPPGK
jgi:hypothetical protein